jgi:hypothetical protein
MPEDFYKEIFHRFQPELKAGDFVVDISADMSMVGEMAVTNRLKYRCGFSFLLLSFATS